MVPNILDHSSAFEADEWSNMFGTKTYHEDPGTVDSDSDDDDQPAPYSTNREHAFKHLERTHTKRVKEHVQDCSPSEPIGTFVDAHDSTSVSSCVEKTQ